MQFINHRLWFSYRGLPPHQFMPMLGVHNGLQRIRSLRSLSFEAER
ncbi:MAG: hypothetical protein AB2697_15005 [Candidatus Thiodiazotropha endolucinida]